MTGILSALTAGAISATLTGCSSQAPTSPVAAASATSAAISPTPAVAATAPAAGECTAFAQDYNSQVGPILTATPGDANVYLTQLADTFVALAAIVSSGTDPYSQTMTADARAVAAAPSSYGALATFTTVLQAFLKSCGMSAGTASASS